MIVTKNSGDAVSYGSDVIDVQDQQSFVLPSRIDIPDASLRVLEN